MASVRVIIFWSVVVGLGVFFQHDFFGAAFAFAQDFELWKFKQPALTIMQVPDDGPFHKERIWYKQFYNPRARAGEFHTRVNGVHVTLDKRPGAKPKAEGKSAKTRAEVKAEAKQAVKEGKTDKGEATK